MIIDVSHASVYNLRSLTPAFAFLVPSTLRLPLGSVHRNEGIHHTLRNVETSRGRSVQSQPPLVVFQAIGSVIGQHVLHGVLSQNVMTGES